jgi:hypothetical protein
MHEGMSRKAHLTANLCVTVQGPRIHLEFPWRYRALGFDQPQNLFDFGRRLGCVVAVQRPFKVADTFAPCLN